MKKTNVLITGINGFIGSSLEGYLRKNRPSWAIYGLDKNAKNTKSRFNASIQHKKKLKKILKIIKPRYIFHFAGIVHNKDLNKLLRINAIPTYCLLSQIKQIKGYRPRIIIPSSAACYGQVNKKSLPIKESRPLKPVNLYGFSKMVQEEISLMFAKQGLDIVIARIFNILGKGVTVNFAIGKFAYELALIKKNKRKPVLHTKGLGSKRDFLDIKDVCACLVRLATHGESGEVYNVCRGESFAIKELLGKLIRISRVRGLKVLEDTKEDRSCIYESVGSNAKMRRIFRKFRPVPIESSLKDSYRYYLKRL